MQLVVQFVHFRSRLFERFFPGRSDHIEPPRSPSAVAGESLEQAGTFQPMEQRIERTRPDAITVVRKLFHHAQPEDRLMASVQ